MAELFIRRGLEEPDSAGAFIPHKPARPEKSEPGRPFRIQSEYQPTAFADLVDGMGDDDRTQVLLGVTSTDRGGFFCTT